MSATLHKWPSRRIRRKFTLTGFCMAVLTITVFYYNHGWLSLSSHVTATEPSNTHLQAQARFWRSFYHVILNNDPQCANPPDIVIPENLQVAFETDHAHNRPDILWIEAPDLARLRAAHQHFVDDIHAADFDLVYERGTRGIVTTVAESQISLLLIQLHMLRLTGSSLPVEVFLSSPSPYLEQICTTLLPTLNASCVYLSHIFKAAGTGVGVSHYQYKMFAILFSTFDSLLLLDSDAWPTSNPDHLFAYPPFTDTGLVVWPDFWYASESPYYFTVANISAPTPLHVKPASESGQLMYTKSRHPLSIYLAAYYNHYGPEYYYPLQSQGAPGQGDKETFHLAATALNEDFYWVHTPVRAMGRTDSSGRFFGSAMVQHDPIVDFSLSPAPKPAFVHPNVPKFDPARIFADFDMGGGLVTSPTRDMNGTWVRCWTASEGEAEDMFGFDVERRFWEVVREVVCGDLRGVRWVETNDKAEGVCDRVNEYLNVVFAVG